MNSEYQRMLEERIHQQNIDKNLEMLFPPKKGQSREQQLKS